MDQLLRHYLFRGASWACNSPWFKDLIERTAVTRASMDEVAAHKWEFGTGDTFTLVPPTSPDELPTKFHSLLDAFEITRPFVAEFRDADLVGPQAVTLTDSGPLFENALGKPLLLVWGLLSAARKGDFPVRGGEPDDTISTAVSFAGPWSRGYYHWFSDYLTRVQGLEEYSREFGVEPTVIIPSDPPQWMRDSLRRAGISSDRWVEWAGGRTRVDRLVVPSVRFETALTATERIVSPRAYRWLAERIKDNVGVSDGRENRIFISREKAAVRRVTNRAEVLSTLEERGFEKYILEDLTFDRQVELFAHADCIVAPHGAGLVNMMYATDATVVTLFGSDLNPCYLTMASGLDFESGFLLGEPKQLDMRIDPDRLARLLNQFDVR